MRTTINNLPNLVAKLGSSFEGYMFGLFATKYFITSSSSSFSSFFGINTKETLYLDCQKHRSVTGTRHKERGGALYMVPVEPVNQNDVWDDT